MLLLSFTVAGEFYDKGVTVMYNNTKVASSVHVLFICVLPSQLPTVIEEIERHLSKQTLVYCLVNHTVAPKLKRTLKSVNIIIPNFIFNSSAALKWDSCMSVHQALEDEGVVCKCCPLSSESLGLYIFSLFICSMHSFICRYY